MDQNYLIEEYATMKELVEDILSKDVKARNSDTYLIAKVWSINCGYEIPEEIVEILPSAESITRVRRKLQNDELLYLADENISSRRRIRADDTREIIGRI